MSIQLKPEMKNNWDLHSTTTVTVEEKEDKGEINSSCNSKCVVQTWKGFQFDLF